MSVEETNLGFEVVYVGSRGLHEVLNNLFDGLCLFDSWNSHKQGIIKKLLVRDMGVFAMEVETRDLALGDNRVEGSSKTLCHNNNNNNNNRITLIRIRRGRR
jgi:hypothetical protein